MFHLYPEDTEKCVLRLYYSFFSKVRIPFLSLRVKALWHPAATSKCRVYLSSECVMITIPANDSESLPGLLNGCGMVSTHLQCLSREASARKKVEAGHCPNRTIFDLFMRCSLQLTFVFLAILTKYLQFYIVLEEIELTCTSICEPLILGTVKLRCFILSHHSVSYICRPRMWVVKVQCYIII